MKRFTSTDLIFTTAERRAKELQRKRADRVAVIVSILFTLVLVLIAIFHPANGHEGLYLELGIGKNDIFDENEWIGRESTGCNFGGGFVYAFKQQYQLDFNFSHYSQCTRGEGFDNRSESALDVFYIKGRYFF